VTDHEALTPLVRVSTAGNLHPQSSRRRVRVRASPISPHRRSASGGGAPHDPDPIRITASLTASLFVPNSPMRQSPVDVARGPREAPDHDPEIEGSTNSGTPGRIDGRGVQSRLSDQFSAVYYEDIPGHERRLVAREESNALRHILGRDRPT